MLTVKLTGKDGHPLKINGEGEASFVMHPHPPKNEEEFTLPFRQHFTDDGTSGGSVDMNVNGLTTNQDFYVSADQEFDIYIKSISLVIGDNGTPNLQKFGGLSALANGVEWIFHTNGEGEYQLHDGIKTNLEFVRLGVDTAGIGTGTDAFLADVSGGGSEKSYLPTIDINETFGMPWGVRLAKGTNDKLVFRVRDDLSAVTTFNAIAYGIRF